MEPTQASSDGPPPRKRSQFKKLLVLFGVAGLALLGALAACPVLLRRGDASRPEVVADQYVAWHPVILEQLRGDPPGTLIFSDPRLGDEREGRRTWEAGVSGPVGNGTVRVDLELRDGSWVVTGGTLAKSDAMTFALPPPVP